MGCALRQCRAVRAYQCRLGRRRLALWTVSARIVTTRAHARPRRRSALAPQRRLAQSSRAARSAVRLQGKPAPTMKANSILDTIGNTPHIRVAKLFPDAEVWVKSERSNPGGSIRS